MKSIYFAPVIMGAFLFSACSPMPKPEYGFTSEYIHKEQDLSKMEVDIKVDNVFPTMYNCNKELLKRGEVFPVLFSLGLIPGCVWTDIWVEKNENDEWEGTIKRCYGFATPSTYKHELEHCKGYDDHPLFGWF